MCSLFGMIDYGKAISETQKMKLIKTLSICCEERGTDATGIAFVTENGIQVKKKAFPCVVNLVCPITTLVFLGSLKRNLRAGTAFFLICILFSVIKAMPVASVPLFSQQIDNVLMSFIFCVSLIAFP